MFCSFSKFVTCKIEIWYSDSYRLFLFLQFVTILSSQTVSCIHILPLTTMLLEINLCKSITPSPPHLRRDCSLRVVVSYWTDRVKEIAPGPIVRVTTNNGDFTTRRLVVTAGPWAPTIMAQLGVKLPFKFSVSAY